MSSGRSSKKLTSTPVEEVVSIIKRQTLAQTGGSDFREVAVALLIRSLRNRHRLTDADRLSNSFLRKFGGVEQPFLADCKGS